MAYHGEKITFRAICCFGVLQCVCQFKFQLLVAMNVTNALANAKPALVFIVARLPAHRDPARFSSRSKDTKFDIDAV